MHRSTLSLVVIVALSLGGLALGDDMAGMNMAPSSQPTTRPSPQASTQPSAAIDLRNTICPVSGDKVGDSNLVEVYGGKVYHLCCPDCHKDIEKDPGKYVKAVTDDPAKFGIK
jgi:YHS domain-containing protein